MIIVKLWETKYACVPILFITCDVEALVRRPPGLSNIRMPLFIAKTRLPSQKWLNRSSGMQRECPLNRSHYIRYNFNAAQAPPQNFCDPQDHTLLVFSVSLASKRWSNPLRKFADLRFWVQTLVVARKQFFDR